MSKRKREIFSLSPLSFCPSVISVPSNKTKRFSNSLNVYRISLIPNIPVIQISPLEEISCSILFELFGRYDYSNISNPNRRVRASIEKSAAVASRMLNERANERPTGPGEETVLLHPLSYPRRSPVVAAFQGAIVNIHEPCAPVAVVIFPVVTRRPVARKFVRELPGAAARREGMEFLSSF